MYSIKKFKDFSKRSRFGSNYSQSNKPASGEPTEEKIKSFFGIGKRDEDEANDKLENVLENYKYPGFDQKHKLGIYEEKPETDSNSNQSSYTDFNTSPSSSSLTSVSIRLDTTTQTTTPSNNTGISMTSISPSSTSTSTPSSTSPAPLYTPLSEEEPVKFPGLNTYPMEFIILSVIWCFLLIYSYFAMSDSKLEEISEELKWGGKNHKLHSLNLLNRYMLFESLGIKVTYRMLSFGIVEDLLGIVISSKDNQIRDEAAKVLCKMCNNNTPLVDELKRLNAFTELRRKVNKSIYVLYLIANLAENEEFAMNMCSDKEFIEEITNMMAFSQIRNEIDDRWRQRGIMRLLNNLIYKQQNGFEAITKDFNPNILDSLLVSPGYVYDPYLLLYQFNIYTKIREKTRKDNLTIFPQVNRLLDQEFMQSLRDYKNVEPISLGIGSALVGGTSFVLAQAYARFYALKQFQPLTIPQKYWLKTNCLRVPLVAIPLFVFHHGLVSFTNIMSDDLYNKKNLKIDYPKAHVIPPFLQGEACERFGWENNESKGKSLLMSVHLTRIPIYFFSLMLSPFSLLTALFPWRVKDNLPPVHVLSLISLMNEIEELVITSPSKPDPTPIEIERVLLGNEKAHQMMIDKLKSLSPTM